MNAMPEKTLSPTPLVGRYRFQQRLSHGGQAVRWLAVDTSTGRTVVALLASAERAQELDAARNVNHRHLAELTQVLRAFEPSSIPGEVTPGAVVAIAEHVPGQTLERALAEQPLAPAKAVAWTLRLIEAAQALHARGAVHGAISPWSIVATPEGRGIAPTLSQLALPSVGAFCTPERLKGAAPSVDDDTWALHATLYMMLTGKLPFDGRQRDGLSKQMLVARPKPLSEARLNEAALSEILMRGLTGDKRLRVTELAELARTLDAWERDPKAMPPRRPPAPRVAPRGLSDLVSSARTNSESVDAIVVDTAELPMEEDWSAAAPSVTGTNAPPLPVAPAAAPVVTALPPPLPSTTAMPPPLPAVSSPPPLPRVSAALPPQLPTPQPQVSALLSSAPEPTSLLGLSAELPKAPTPLPLVVPIPAQPVARRLSYNPFEKKRKVWPIALGAALISGVGVYLAVGGSPSASAPAVVAAPQPQDAKPKLAEKPKLSAEEQRNTCVKSYFSDYTFDAQADFSFVCQDSDFREISRQVFTALREHAKPSGNAPPGRGSILSQGGLGWYELPAAGMIRKSCCAAAPPITLPQTVGWCEQMQSVVRRIADDSAKAGDLAPAAKSFDKAVSCLYATRVMRPYSYERPPSADQKKAFQSFLSLAAISEAKR